MSMSWSTAQMNPMSSRATAVAATCLGFLAAFERSADGRASSVAPGGLDEHVSAARVAGLGDGPLSSSVAGGVLAGHQPQVGHERTRVLEAAEVAEFGGQDHGGAGLEAPEAGDAVDEGLVARREGQLLDAAVELVPALELVLEEGEVFGQDHAVVGGEGAGLEDLTDPVHVARGPVGALAVDEAPAPEAS